MRGVGGPLLTIGDLLADLVDDSREVAVITSNLESDAISGPLDLIRLFQEKYGKLDGAFAASDHSWTSLTLELCTALETANDLIHATAENARLLSGKVEALDKIVKQGDSGVAAARTVHATLKLNGV